MHARLIIIRHSLFYLISALLGRQVQYKHSSNKQSLLCYSGDLTRWHNCKFLTIPSCVTQHAPLIWNSLFFTYATLSCQVVKILGYIGVLDNHLLMNRSQVQFSTKFTKWDQFLFSLNTKSLVLINFKPHRNRGCVTLRPCHLH